MCVKEGDVSESPYEWRRHGHGVLCNRQHKHHEILNLCFLIDLHKIRGK